MSLRLEMLQVTRLAPNLLHEASDRIVAFLRGQISADGGGMDRSGDGDLYYTVFTVEGLIALRAELPIDRLRSYLERFRDGDGLDFVHLTCLARCWAALPEGQPAPDVSRRLLERVERFRSRDGGYNANREARAGTIYHDFLALGAYQDCGRPLPRRDHLGKSIAALRTADGAFANQRGLKIGTTTATAAAVTLLRHLDLPAPEPVGEWLRAQCHAGGGFLATPGAPMPDLLSTATALHALAGMQVSFEDLKPRCLDYIDTLWTGRAFCGHWADDIQDSEYTFYALLALGHLSL